MYPYTFNYLLGTLSSLNLEKKHAFSLSLLGIGKDMERLGDRRCMLTLSTRGENS